jgi:hypothetical protein
LNVNHCKILHLQMYEYVKVQNALKNQDSYNTIQHGYQKTDKWRQN